MQNTLRLLLTSEGKMHIVTDKQLMEFQKEEKTNGVKWNSKNKFAH